VWCHTLIISATQEAEIGTLQFENSLGKVRDPISKIKLYVVEHACGSSYLADRGRRIIAQAKALEPI
jgi:hypothetical protein